MAFFPCSACLQHSDGARPAVIELWLWLLRFQGWGCVAFPHFTSLHVSGVHQSTPLTAGAGKATAPSKDPLLLPTGEQRVSTKLPACLALSTS